MKSMYTQELEKNLEERAKKPGVKITCSSKGIETTYRLTDLYVERDQSGRERLVFDLKTEKQKSIS